MTLCIANLSPAQASHLSEDAQIALPVPVVVKEAETYSLCKLLATFTHAKVVFALLQHPYLWVEPLHVIGQRHSISENCTALLALLSRTPSILNSAPYLDLIGPRGMKP